MSFPCFWPPAGAEAAIQEVSQGSSGSISLTADVASIPADGSSSATIRAVVTDSAGNPVRNFTDVTFTTSLGHFRNGSYTYTVQTQPPLVATASEPPAAPTGVVETALIAGTKAGSAKVTVRSNNVRKRFILPLPAVAIQGCPWERHSVCQRPTST